MLDAALEPLDRLREGRLRDRQGEVVDDARLPRRRPALRLALLAGEDRDQAAVPWIEVQVALARVVEVRLLEDERHTEYAFPEVERRLAVRTVDRDVVDALDLDLSHDEPQHIVATIHGVASYAVNSKAVARARKLIESRQYVLDSE